MSRSSSDEVLKPVLEPIGVDVICVVLDTIVAAVVVVVVDDSKADRKSVCANELIRCDDDGEEDEDVGTAVGFNIDVVIPLPLRSALQM